MTVWISVAEAAGTRRQVARAFFPDGELPDEVVDRIADIVARAIMGD
jgi:hypothetical protein